MKRNIVVILCDQLRPDFLEVYGCEAVPTPALRRLANDGALFTRAITCSPVCAPARASMMTGRYPSDHGVWTNDVPFRDGMELLPERMAALGYESGCFGKLHHYPAKDAKGFQHVRQMEEGRLGKDEPYLRWLREQGGEDLEDIWHFDPEKLEFKLDDALHYEQWIAGEALKFVQSSSRRGRPFFAWLSFQGPHAPYNPPKGAKGGVLAEGLPSVLEREPGERICPTHSYRSAYLPPPSSRERILRERVAYAECIVNIDSQIGRLLDELDRLGIYKDTTLIFSSDHGDLLGDFRGVGKGPFAYGGQLDVPLIVSNHPRIEAGSRPSSLAGNIDIPATVLEIAGAAEGLAMSRSLIDLAQASPSYPRDVNFSEYGDGIKIAESRDYRYAHYPFLGFSELFDMREDPKQLRNLAGKDRFKDIEIGFLRDLHDLALLCKGVEIPGFDLIPPVQKGLKRLHPRYDKPGDFKAAFPLNLHFKRNLKEADMDPNYTNWYKNHEVKAHYGFDFEDLD